MNTSPRLMVAGFAGLIALLIAAEIGFRVVVGDRLLYRTDPGFEYFPQPDQSVVRLGVRFETNALGMRSPAFERNKPDGVLRILVLGDSVVFGHTNISNKDLATTLLSRQISSGERIEALNVSAPAWGPGNIAAWLDANGTMSADKAIIVLATHDLDDDRTFVLPDANVYPQQNPVSALIDAALRQFSVSETETDTPTGDARRSVRALLARLASLPSGACVVIHTTRAEFSDAEAGDDIAKLATEAGLTTVRDRNYLDAESSYVDDIHLSVAGQRQLQAGAMAECLSSASGI